MWIFSCWGWGLPGSLGGLRFLGLEQGSVGGVGRKPLRYVLGFWGLRVLGLNLREEDLGL